MDRKIKVVIAKLGLDIHWRGVYLVAQYLKEAGMDVVYLGNKFPAEIVEAAIEEDADVVGLSSLCGNHLALGPMVVDMLKEKGHDLVGVRFNLWTDPLAPAEAQLLSNKCCDAQSAARAKHISETLEFPYL